MNIEIRPYQPSDHCDVVTLITTIQQNEFGLPITYEDQPDLADIPKFFDLFLVAVVSEKAIGSIGLKIIGDFAVIRKMFVAQENRGREQGIAQKLLMALEEEIAARGINKIYLGTTEFFTAAHRFYERNDYLEISMSDLPSDFPVMKIDTKFFCKINL
ncbi:MAG: GNAT family N-acetyltransferase [Verrucomicrobiae bacterium]|nr:GNAT family N-acetyltransferase [Verrucomicrobiae bacterium]